MATRMKPSLRPKMADALVALAVVLLAGALIFAASGRVPAENMAAVISRGGAVVETVNLTVLDGPETRTLTAGGYTLCLTLWPDGAEMTESDCPTQDCVHTGKITRAGQSIVCLPARVSIVLTGTSDGGVDAVVG